MKNSILRIIDANMNRAMEGIRVVEDVLRFEFNHKPLSNALKIWRSDLKKVSDDLPFSRIDLLKSRSSHNDVGADSYSAGEEKRSSFYEIITSNLKRAQESMRVLEECGKLCGKAFGRKFKALRFRLYTLEKQILELYDKKQKLDFDLYVITDPGSIHSSEKLAKEAIKGGVKIVQLRDKYASKSEFIREAKRIREITKKAGVTFIINDHVDVCKLVDADGVNIGQDDLPISEARKILGEDKIIGVSASNLRQALKAQKEGADYVGIGPIFETPIKKGYKPAGLSLIRQTRNKLKVPFVVIGGINETNIKDVIKAGAKRVAVIRAVASKKNIVKAVRSLRHSLTARA